MTSASREISIASGKPVRLYLFKRGITTWGYCTADRDIIYNSVVYRSCSISDSGIRQSGNATSDEFEITAPANLPIPQLYRGLGPSSPTAINVMDMHYGETDALIAYIGEIYAVKFPAEDRCTIVCQNNQASLNQTGLNMTWSKGCEHVWGGPRCGVNRDTYNVLATVLELDGTTITVGITGSFADGWFSGGYVEWPTTSGVAETRGIEFHAGTSLRLFGGTDGIALGQDLSLFPGCDLTIQTCHDKFNNHPNYSGAPHMPGINPFSSTTVF